MPPPGLFSAQTATWPNAVRSQPPYRAMKVIAWGGHATSSCTNGLHPRSDVAALARVPDGTVPDHIAA
jgi:hypothetical protein